MDTARMCSRLRETTFFVNVFDGTQHEPLNPETDISVGSAVAINSRGDLLTAAHVVTGHFPIREEDLQDPDVVILAMNKGRRRWVFHEYTLFGHITSLTTPLSKEPLTIDLAILRPITPQSNVPHLKIRETPTPVGTKVLMAGFPDDMELPFNLAHNYEPSSEVSEINRFPNLQFRVAKKLLMIKSGMIGYQTPVHLTDGNRTLDGEVFYIDNELHSGASGGPAVDASLEVIGILTERAITSMSTEFTPGLRVPSGSTVAFSPRFIQHELDKLDG